MIKIQTGKVTVVTNDYVHDPDTEWSWTEPGRTYDYEVRYEEIGDKKYAHIWNVSEDQYQVYPPYATACLLDIDFSTEESANVALAGVSRAFGGLASVTWTQPLTTIFESN